MSNPPCSDFTGTIPASFLTDTVLPLINTAFGYYNTAFNAASSPSPVRTNIQNGCSTLMSLLSQAETALGQTSGALTPSGGTSK